MLKKASNIGETVKVAQAHANYRLYGYNHITRLCDRHRLSVDVSRVIHKITCRFTRNEVEG